MDAHTANQDSKTAIIDVINKQIKDAVLLGKKRSAAIVHIEDVNHVTTYFENRGYCVNLKKDCEATNYDTNLVLVYVFWDQKSLKPIKQQYRS
jgi:hypothetical protein